MTRGARFLAAVCLAAILVALYLRGFMNRPAAQPSPRAPGHIRIATWNAGWLLDEVRENRCRAMTKVIESLDADVLALQEVESKYAARKVLPKGYEVAMVDDPQEDQELAVAYKSGIKLLRPPKLLFQDSRFDYAFPSRRNAIEAALSLPGGEEVVFIGDQVIAKVSFKIDVFGNMELQVSITYRLQGIVKSIPVF